MKQPDERPDDRSTDRPEPQHAAEQLPGGDRSDAANPAAEVPDGQPTVGGQDSTAEDADGTADDADSTAHDADSTADDADSGETTDPTRSGGEDSDNRDQGDDTPVAGDTAGAQGPRRVLAITASVIGELLITAGVVLGLFVAYSLWWTNVQANQQAQRDGDAVRDAWEQQPPSDQDDEPEAREYDAETDDGVGFLHVPEMTGDDEILIKNGVDLDILNGGVAGLYDAPVESAMPWDEEGNVSLAAHRDGHGAKFHDIDRLDDGDAIVFETRDTWYIYRVYATLPETTPLNTPVLDPIPEESGVDEPGRYLTLTTCTPVYSSAYRYIVWGELERTEEVDALRTPPEELSES